MGVVLKAYDTELHRVVAIKVLLPHLATSSAARRRFAREAKAAAAVVHEHVIPIHDVESDGSPPYLVMQFVPGHSLQTRVDERGPLEIKEVLRIAGRRRPDWRRPTPRGSCTGTSSRPTSCWRTRSIACCSRISGWPARSTTPPSRGRECWPARPHYMSPEQASGLSVDQRSDLFSLGSVIYFMCTGRPPYRSESPMAILNRICHKAHRPVDDVNPDVPIELAEVVDRLLAKDPDERFATAREVEARLCRALGPPTAGTPVSRRRSWWRQLQQRSLRNGGKTVKRLTIGMTAAAACMLIGASLTRLLTPRTTAPSDGAASTSANAEILKAVLPDTFAREITEVDGQLATIEARNAFDSAASVSAAIRYGKATSPSCKLTFRRWKNPSGVGHPRPRPTPLTPRPKGRNDESNGSTRLVRLRARLRHTADPVAGLGTIAGPATGRARSTTTLKNPPRNRPPDCPAYNHPPNRTRQNLPESACPGSPGTDRRFRGQFRSWWRTCWARWVHLAWAASQSRPVRGRDQGPRSPAPGDRQAQVGEE